MRSLHRKIGPSSLYIHFPFCRKRCSYCGLTSTQGELSYIGKYVKALRKELTCRCKDLELSTIFIGGGTPSLISSQLLVELFECIRNVASVPSDCEISIEVNPESMTPELADTFVICGINRVSMGVQSLVEDELHHLGRLHSVSDVERAFEVLRKRGITNISLDLIGAFPHHSLENWNISLERAMALKPVHTSLYLYHQEDGTLFDRLLTTGELVSNDEDTDVAIYTRGLSVMEENSLRQYEISSFSKTGYRCRHNINYWLNGEYVGIGAGAASYEDGVRFVAVASPVYVRERNK